MSRMVLLPPLNLSKKERKLFDFVAEHLALLLDPADIIVMMGIFFLETTLFTKIDSMASSIILLFGLALILEIIFAISKWSFFLPFQLPRKFRQQFIKSFFIIGRLETTKND